LPRMAPSAAARAKVLALAFPARPAAPDPAAAAAATAQPSG
jgi:hypothetical protein